MPGPVTRGLSAFIFSGRFSVIVATRSAVSYRMVSYAIAFSFAPRRSR
jgi:hypothetical protein